MTREFTDEELERLGMTRKQSPFANRGWSPEEIKQKIKDEGFTIAGFERQLDLPVGSINQSLRKRSPKTDKLIAAFLNVHESEIWPNRYFCNGVSINALYNIEERSDEELKKLNDQIRNPPPRTVITSWVGAADGGPMVQHVKERTVAERVNLPKGDDGRFIVPLGDGVDYPDVSPMANERHVKLPPGIVIDEKP